MLFKDDFEVAPEEEVVEPAEGQTDTPAEDATQDPNEVIRAMREDREKDRLRVEALEKQNEFYRDVAMQTPRRTSDPVPHLTPQQQAKFQHDDILTYGEIEAEMGTRLAEVNKEMAKLRGQLTEEAVKKQYPDYADVINKHVMPLVTADPRLMEEIDRQPNPALYAYRLGITSEGYIREQKSQAASKIADKVEKNLNKPATLSGVSGASNTGYKPGSIANMTSEQFAKFRRERLGEE